MEESGENPVILPPQVVEKPTSVTVFGVLNIVLGCYFLARIIYSWSRILPEIFKDPEKTTVGAVLIVVANIALMIWLIVLGVGLLTMKRGARRGSIAWARIKIVLTVISICLLILSLSRTWSSMPKDKLDNFIFLIVSSMIQSLIYPVLLLVFM